MSEKFYHQIDPVSGEILGLTLGKWDLNVFHYIREQDDDPIFTDAWRRSWPNDKPLLKELKLFRAWIRADRAFKAVGDRLRLQK